MSSTVRANKIAAFVLAIIAAACSHDLPTGSGFTAAVGARTDSRMEALGDQSDVLTVMSRNVYLGASFDPLFAEANPFAVPYRGGEIWERIQATNAPERMRAIAAEIAREKPDLVGLQEVALFRTQMPADNYPGGRNSEATDVAYDFLTLLSDELRRLNLQYDVVAELVGVDAEAIAVLPGDTLPPIDIRFTDREVILAKRGVTVDNVQSGIFAARLTIPLGGAPFERLRGWVSIDVKHRGEWIRFASTHLETEEFGFAQEPQGAELRQILLSSPYPVIVVGDLNSAADGHNTATYASFVADGYVDAWSQPLGGYTCCQSELLRNEVSQATERIDYVLTFGPLSVVEARLTGIEPRARTSGGLWPSDHAGVVASLRVAKP